MKLSRRLGSRRHPPRDVAPQYAGFHDVGLVDLEAVLALLAAQPARTTRSISASE
jgi:hypothetical protein